jgi:hypothetical protein
MQKRNFRVLSAMTAGSLALALAVAGFTESSGPGRPATHGAVLAAQTESSSAVNLDACPILHTGYPQGGCVAQLQTELDTLGDQLTVDGIFGSVGSQTYDAVIAFQQAHGLQPDGMVGPATKQALDAALSVPTPVLTPSTVAPVSAPTAAASGSTGVSGTSTSTGTSLGPVTFNCGYFECSAYLSRSVTKAAYEKSSVGLGGFAAAATLICGALAVPPLTPVGAACAAAAAFQGPWINQEIGDAATQHGAAGACLKVTYTKPTRSIPPVITWWSTNNGQFCQN